MSFLWYKPLAEVFMPLGAIPLVVFSTPATDTRPSGAWGPSNPLIRKASKTGFEILSLLLASTRESTCCLVEAVSNSYTRVWTPGKYSTCTSARSKEAHMGRTVFMGSKKPGRLSTPRLWYRLYEFPSSARL